MDQRGTSYAITDVNQNILTSYVQDAFGRPLASTGGSDPNVPNLLQYQSNWLTQNIGGKNILLSKYRPYDPMLGIFTQRDFLRFLNLYRCWSNNPVNQIDWNGLYGVNDNIQDSVRDLLDNGDANRERTENEKNAKRDKYDTALADLDKDFKDKADYDAKLKNFSDAVRDLFYGIPEGGNTANPEELGFGFKYKLGGFVLKNIYKQEGTGIQVVKDFTGKVVLSLDTTFLDKVAGVDGDLGPRDFHGAKLKELVEGKQYLNGSVLCGTVELSWSGTWKSNVTSTENSRDVQFAFKQDGWVQPPNQNKRDIKIPWSKQGENGGLPVLITEPIVPKGGEKLKSVEHKMSARFNYSLTTNKFIYTITVHPENKPYR